MKTRGEIAEEYFMKGYNCSQSVAAAFSDEIGLDPDTILKMTAGYGGGVARMREVCGAFLGLVFVAGALYGNTDPAGKSAFYSEIQGLAGQYRSQNGGNSIICRELLGLGKAESSPTASERTPEYYKKRPCPKLVALAAEIMEQYIEEHPLNK